MRPSPRCARTASRSSIRPRRRPPRGGARKGESPNKILRDRCQFAVIHRPVCTIPAIQTNFKKSIDIDVVRIATGGTYEDAGRASGATPPVSLRVIERAPCRSRARFAFKLAMIRKSSVVSTSKYTIQRETDGLFEERSGRRRGLPGDPFRRELFDSLLAGLVMNPERYAVIVTPERVRRLPLGHGLRPDRLVGLGDSSSYAFDDEGKITLAMFDPAGGTAPDIAGKNLANPTRRCSRSRTSCVTSARSTPARSSGARSSRRSPPAAGRRTSAARRGRRSSRRSSPRRSSASPARA
jgi:isocitrate/isopropylmalate dehydrogenase